LKAATLIVASIAASSILIALAFVLSGSSDSKGSTVARTVTEKVVVPAPQKEESEISAGEGGTSQVGGPTPCAGGELTVEDVSCEIGAQVHAQFEEGGRGELLAEDANETLTMTCDEGTTPITCTGPGGAKVYFGK
jgi:hypothetical protein